MLIKLALDAMLSILKVLFGWLTLPSMPANVEAFVTNLCYYISAAMKFIFVFIDRNLLVTLVGLMVALLALARTWDLIWWIIGKVPMLNIKKE